MVSNRWNSLAALALAGAGLAGLSFAAEEEAPPATEVEIVARAAEEGQPVPVEVVVNEQRQQLVLAAESGEEASPYWIGVQLEPPTDILKEHLKLDGGLVTVHVFEDSPAAKAGLKANDIILKAADTYIKEPGDLLKLVGKAQENELTLVLLRGGKETTLKVVPAKRARATEQQQVREAASEEKEAVRNLAEALDAYKRRSANIEAPAVDVVRLRPGVVASRTIERLNLPKDVAVIITKEGAAPAKIVVKKDGKEYEATEDKLEKLPDDVRGYVQIVRGGGGNAFAYRALGELVAPATAKTAKAYRATTVAPVPAPASATEAAKVYRYQVQQRHASDDVDSKLDQILKIVSQQEDNSVSELRKEVKQLRKELEELRQEKK